MADVAQTFALNPYAAEQARIQRLQKYADILQSQAQQPDEKFSYAGIEAPTSVAGGLAKALKMGVSGYLQGSGMRSSEDLANKMTTDREEDLRKFFTAVKGTPATPEGGGMGENADQGSFAKPAVPGSLSAGYQALLRARDPALQNMGMAGSMDEAKMERNRRLSATLFGEPPVVPAAAELPPSAGSTAAGASQPGMVPGMVSGTTPPGAPPPMPVPQDTTAVPLTPQQRQILQTMVASGENPAVVAKVYADMIKANQTNATTRRGQDLREQPPEVKEYQYAVNNGFLGSYLDYQKAKQSARASPATDFYSSGGVYRLAPENDGPGRVVTVLVSKTGSRFYEEKGALVPLPDTAIPTTPGQAQPPLSRNDFNKLVFQTYDEQTGIAKINKYLENVQGANTGLSGLADAISFKINTIFSDAGGNLTKAEMNRQVAAGQVHGLIGMLRTTIMGPGVVTEYDAQRILAAVGGDVSVLQNPQVVKALLEDILEDKKNRLSILKQQIKEQAGVYNPPKDLFGKDSSSVGTHQRPPGRTPEEEDEYKKLLADEAQNGKKQ